MDIRDRAAVDALFASERFDLVVHAAAQPSHDLAAKRPFDDFDVNAVGTLNLLEACRRHTAEAVFIFMSTNKVYGDGPNHVPLVEHETRWEYGDAKYAHGIAEDFSIDRCLHSLFGASKVAADVLTQEYGRYFGMKTGVFRGGCLTGPHHAGVELHGFLNYLVLAALEERPYTIFGYKGKQVRDQIHARDVIASFWAFAQAPRPGEVVQPRRRQGQRREPPRVRRQDREAHRQAPQAHLLRSEPDRRSHLLLQRSAQAPGSLSGWKVRYSLDAIIGRDDRQDVEAVLT